MGQRAFQPGLHVAGFSSSFLVLERFVLGRQPLPGWEEGMLQGGSCFLASALPWGAPSEGGTSRVQAGNQLKRTQPIAGAQHKLVMGDATWQSIEEGLNPARMGWIPHWATAQPRRFSPSQPGPWGEAMPGQAESCGIPLCHPLPRLAQHLQTLRCSAGLSLPSSPRLRRAGPRGVAPPISRYFPKSSSLQPLWFQRLG